MTIFDGRVVLRYVFMHHVRPPDYVLEIDLERMTQCSLGVVAGEGKRVLGRIFGFVEVAFQGLVGELFEWDAPPFTVSNWSGEWSAGCLSGVFDRGALVPRVLLIPSVVILVSPIVVILIPVIVVVVPVIVVLIPLLVLVLPPPANLRIIGVPSVVLPVVIRVVRVIVGVVIGVVTSSSSPITPVIIPTLSLVLVVLVVAVSSVLSSAPAILIPSLTASAAFLSAHNRGCSHVPGTRRA